MKKPTILTLLFLFFIINAICQESKVSIGLVGSLEFNNYYFNETGFNSIYNFESSIGTTAGIVFNYKLTDKIHLQSGLSYNLQRYQTYYRFITPTHPPSIDPALPNRTELNISQLRVPVMVGYELVNEGNLRVTPFAGLRFGLGINEKETTIYNDLHKETTEILNTNLNHIQVIMNLDVRIEYHIGEKTFVGLTPFVGKGLNKIDEEIMDSGQFTYGGFLGLYFKI